MDMETRHIEERNKLLYRVAFIFLATYIVLCVGGIFVNKGSGTAIFRVAVQVIALIAEFVCYLNFSKKDFGRKICLYIILVVYIVSLWTTPNVYMYAFMFPVVVMVMSFMDRKICMIGAIGAIVTDAVYAVLAATVYKTAPFNEIVTMLVICVLTSYLATKIVAMTQRHNNEKMDLLNGTFKEREKTAETLRNMSLEINTKIENASDLVQSLVDAVETSTASANEIADSVKLTAEAVESQTFMTNDIQGSLKVAEERTVEMSTASSRAMENVQEGMNALENLKKQAEITAEINTETKATTEELNKCIKEVEAIIGTILNISSQTNLLALNASIEAARAGDAGRGFAVVADEIRNLSEGTKQSTEQIQAIINKLTEDVNKANENMARSVESSEKQNELISDTSDKFEIIRKEVIGLGENVKGITGEVTSIVSANTKIVDSISNLSATSEEVAASSESSIGVSNDSLRYTQNMKVVLDDIQKVSQQMKELM